jgi:hypothetical protein
MQEIVINSCYGGFGLSPLAIHSYLKLKGKKVYFYVQTKYNFKDGAEEYARMKLGSISSDLFYSVLKDLGKVISEFPNSEDYWFSDRDIPRNDCDLVKVVKKLGSEANGRFSNLKVVKIPNKVKWMIDEYDGLESVEEKHRSWG